jgi:hypothetical protein
MAVGLCASLIVVASALAATLENGNGQSCPDGGSWHFVNTQSGGGSTSITVVFNTGSVTDGPSEVLKNTTHYRIEAAGTLITAFNNNPGKIVLSDFTCDGEKDPDPK